MNCFNESTKNNQVSKGDGYIHDMELNNERTTLDFNGELSSLTSMQNY